MRRTNAYHMHTQNIQIVMHHALKNLSRNGAALCKNMHFLKCSVFCRPEGSHGRAKHVTTCSKQKCMLHQSQQIQARSTPPCSMHVACLLHACCTQIEKKQHYAIMHTRCIHITHAPCIKCTCLTSCQSQKRIQHAHKLAACAKARIINNLHTHTHKCSMRLVCMPIQNAYNRANIPLPCITRSNPMQFEGSHAKAKHAQSTQATMHT